MLSGFEKGEPPKISTVFVLFSVLREGTLCVFVCVCVYVCVCVRERERERERGHALLQIWQFSFKLVLARYSQESLINMPSFYDKSLNSVHMPDQTLADITNQANPHFAK